jgi:hypothetical protein
VPFSAANWIAQSNNAAPTTIPASGAVKLGSPLANAAYTGSGAALSPNPLYYADTTFGRDTYLVVEAARITSSDAKYDANLAALLNPSKASLTNMSASITSPGGVKRAFGFLAVADTTILYSNLK